MMTRPMSTPPRSSARPSRRLLGTAVVAVLALTAVTGAGSPAAASAEPTPVTRAALDPALVEGRGADVAFLEQEAENAVTNGELLGPDRTAYTLPAEASGRTAVQLDPGEHVEFTLP